MIRRCVVSSDDRGSARRARWHVSGQVWHESGCAVFCVVIVIVVFAPKMYTQVYAERDGCRVELCSDRRCRAVAGTGGGRVRRQQLVTRAYAALSWFRFIIVIFRGFFLQLFDGGSVRRRRRVSRDDIHRLDRRQRKKTRRNFFITFLQCRTTTCLQYDVQRPVAEHGGVQRRRRDAVSTRRSGVTTSRQQPFVAVCMSPGTLSQEYARRTACRATTRICGRRARRR